MKQPISIEALLTWAYRDQMAELESETPDRVGWPGASRDGCATVEWIGQLGCMPDRGPSMHGLTRPERLGDASLVVTAVRVTCRHATRDLVEHHARTGSRPDWKPTARHRLEPLGWVTLAKDRRDWGARAGDELAETENWYDPDDRREYRVCPLIEMDSPEITAYHRDLYAEWWDALEAMRAWLSVAGRLMQHQVTDQMPPREPWREERDIVLATARMEPREKCA